MNILKKLISSFVPSKKAIGKNVLFSAQQIADMLNGTIIGNAEVKISNIAKIEKGEKGDLCFLANMKYEKYLYTNKASITIVGDDFIPKKPISGTLIKVNAPYTALPTLLSKFENKSNIYKNKIEKFTHISRTATFGKNKYIGSFAYIGNNVKIGNNVAIYPHVFIGDNVQIGDDVTLYSGVKIYHDCILGNRIMIHSGAVIGADGFGFAKQEDGTYKKIPQIGIVVIEDDVEIGANTTIDRATMNATIIKKGVKLDNLIMIAHNVSIGENTVMAAQCGIAGSSKVGKNTMFGGQAGVAGHFNIPDGTKLASQTGVIGDIHGENKSILGTPALNAREQLRLWALTRQLPTIVKRIEALEQTNTTKQ